MRSFQHNPATAREQRFGARSPGKLTALVPRLQGGWEHAPATDKREQAPGAVVDHATPLRKNAVPGDMVMSGKLAAAVLIELGRLAISTRGTHAESARSWLAARTP
jgi:hypothetical protein